VASCVNLDGPFFAASTALVALAETYLRASGSIVNLSSIVPRHRQAVTILRAYNASRGGVRLLTQSVRLHGRAPQPPVRCNSVHPAFLKALWWTTFRAPTGRPISLGAASSRLATNPASDCSARAEVSDLCVYLLSDGLSPITSPGSDFTIPTAPHLRDTRGARSRLILLYSRARLLRMKT